MYQIIALPVLMILGLRTIEKISNYPYLLMGNFVLSVATRFFERQVVLGFGALSLFNNDITIIFLLIAMLAHHKCFTVRKKMVNMLTVTTLVMTIYSMCMGLSENGFNSWWLYDVRKFLFHIVLIIFASTINVQLNLYKVKRWAERVAYALVIYIYIATVVHFVFGMQIGIYTDERPLVSHYAITLVVYILYEVYCQLYKQERPNISLKTMFAILAVVVNRYNTTWVAMFVGIAFLIVFMPNKVKLMNRKFIAQCACAVGCLLVLQKVFGDSNVMDAIVATGDKFNKMEEQDSTFSSRVELWVAMISSLKNTSILTGFSMGSGYYVNYRGTIWQFNPHNGYVETIMRLGIIGCASLIITYLHCIIATVKRHRYLETAAVLAMACYFVAYTYEFELSFILGVIMGNLINKEYVGEELL